MIRQPIRQGDVTLYPVDETPQGEQQPRDGRGRLVLAEGEATGHAHAITDRQATLYGTELETRFLQVLAEGGVDLVHEEHATVTIPAGTWQVLIGRVWEPEGTRRVYD
jgi:hypothetical protein